LLSQAKYIYFERAGVRWKISLEVEQLRSLEIFNKPPLLTGEGWGEVVIS